MTSTIVADMLVGLGILAELNLLRIFLRAWREERRAGPVGLLPIARQRLPGAFARSPLTRRGLAACLALPLVTLSVARAQPTYTPAPDSAKPAASAQPEAAKAQPDAAQPAAEAKSPFSLQLNLDYTTAYFYHGIVQEDSGLILQPAARLTINLYEHDDFRVDAILGMWNSFQGQKTGAQTHGDFTEYWYEADWIGGIALTKGKWSLLTTYTFLTSPSDAYETVQELDFTLAYDDSELLGKFALHPYVLLGVETGADASDGANSDTGAYLELGIAPGFSFDVGKTSIALSFPVSVGLSLHDYYQNAAGDDDTFGFVQAGVKASVPLPFTERYGKWTVNAGVFAMYLGDNTAGYNGGDHQQFIGTIGIQLNF